MTYGVRERVRNYTVKRESVFSETQRKEKGKPKRIRKANGPTNNQDRYKYNIRRGL